MIDTPLIKAIRQGLSDNIIKDLIKNETDINKLNSEGYTALMYLINLDPHKYGLIKELVKVSDCNVKDSFGYNILFILLQGIISNQFQEDESIKIFKILVANTDLSIKCGGIDVIDYLQSKEKYFIGRKRRDLYLQLEYILVSTILHRDRSQI